VKIIVLAFSYICIKFYAVKSFYKYFRKEKNMKIRRIFLYLINILIIYIPNNSKAEIIVFQNLSRIPITFTETKRQAGDPPCYTSHMLNKSISFSPSGVTFLLSRETDASRTKRSVKRSVVFTNSTDDSEPVELKRNILHLRFEGANKNPAVIGENRLPWNTNYFRGNDPSQWKTDVPNYAGVRYHDLYPGIDLVYSGRENRLKYDFIIRQGLDPSLIRLSYKGASGIRINSAGDLEVNTPAGTLVEKMPYCYQEIHGNKIEVSARYIIWDQASCSYGFETGPYNSAYPLIIDPELVFSTFLGGKGFDGCIKVAVDKLGYIYLAGGTQSQDFPATPDAYDSTYGWLTDIYVTKLDPSGKTILYSTFLGRGRDKYPFGMDVDEQGNVCIAGTTPENTFPTTPGSYSSPDESWFHSDTRMFVAKLNSMGNKLLFSAVFGNPDHSPISHHMKLDTDGNICVAGLGLINTTPDAIQKSPGDTFTPLIFKLSADGSALLYASYFDFGDKTVGFLSQQIKGMDVDRQGNIYLVGGISGYPDNISFPVTEGCLDNQFSHYPDSSLRANGFIVKMNPQGGLVYSSFLFHSYPQAICVDSCGAMYVVGDPSPNNLFPISEDAYEKERIDSSSRLLFKISSTGHELIFSTYLFNAGIYGLEVDGEGNVFLAGEAFDTRPIPITPYTYDSTFNGGSHDIFLCKINSLGSNLLYSTYIGSSGYDIFGGLALDNSGNVYLAGSTDFRDFPTTEGAWDRSFGGESDIFLCKFSFSPGPVKVEETPRAFSLAPAYPNPFNPSTTISFSLPAPGHASLAVHDITGRKVRTLASGSLDAGAHSITWDSRDDSGKPVASGVYLARLQSDGRVASAKMLLMK
jgi:hypothetical protein